jgi:hypothetical protein
LLQVPLALMVFGPTFVLVQILAVDVLMLVGCLWVLLRLTGYLSRFRQTLTALLGTSALLSILSAPFSAWRQLDANPDSGGALSATIIFAIMLWSIAIDGHIISRALSKPFGIGLMVAVFYFFLHTLALLELLPSELAV